MERLRNTFRYMTLLMLASVMFLSFFGNFEEINDHYRFAFGGDRTESSASAEAVIQSGDLAMLSALQSFVQTGRKIVKGGLGGCILSPVYMEASPCHDALRKPRLSAQTITPEDRYINTVKKLE